MFSFSNVFFPIYALGLKYFMLGNGAFLAFTNATVFCHKLRCVCITALRGLFKLM